MSKHRIRVERPTYARRGSTLLIVVVEDAQGTEVFRDRADLNAEKARLKVADRIAQVTGGNPDTINRRLLEGLARLAPPAPWGNGASTGAPATQYPYEATPGGLIWNKKTPEGVIPTPLTTFTATITGQVVEDSGAEARRLLEIEATMRGRTYRFQVPAGQFASMNWPMEHMGAGAALWPGFAIKDHARAAIQFLSGEPPERRVYAHLGWREIGGQWFYLHAGGAIGTVGPLPDVQVSLSPHLQLYCLPEPPTGPDLADAVRASLRLLEVAGDRVTLPIYCSIWRVVLEGSDSGLHLVGQTGSGKTELAALAQQHYGPGMDSRHLPGSWLSTDNALETLAFLAKDALLVVDDFCPGGDQYKVQSMHAKADRLFRAQGNAAGRGRLRFDGTLRPVKPPRGLILSTGEDVPRGQSLRAWMLVVEVPKVGEDAVDWDRLSECQRDAAAGLYARAMAGFIRWLAPSTGTSRQWLRGEIDALRAHAYQGGQHRRTADIAANLALGFRHFLAFAQAVGAVDQAQAEALWRRCWTALGKAAATQAEDQLDSDPAQRFLDLLAAAISSGRAHLSNGLGRAPEQATARGWKESEIGAGEYTRTELRPQGEHIGWLDQMNIYLQADAAYAVVQRLARDEGDHLSVTLATLKKRLKERGLLASTEKRTVEGREVERLEVHRTLQGKRRAVLHLNAISLAYPPTESAPSVPNAPQHRKSYLLKDGNGAQIGNPSQKVHHESALENGPAVSEDGDAGALGALGTQIARGEGESHRKNPGRDPWDQFLEEATEP